MTYDGTNRKHIRQAEKRSKLEENNRVVYTRQIMSTLAGRAWMYDWLTRCSMFHEPFSPVSPHATSYNCGRQSIGRQLFDDVFTNTPTEYALMIQEAQAKETVDGRRNDDTDDRNASAERPGGEDLRRHPEGSRGFDIDDNGYVIDASEAGDDDAGPGPEVTH